MKQVVLFISNLILFMVSKGQLTSKADSSIRFKQETISAKLYPNPATNKTEVFVNGFQPGILQLKIMDRNGMLYRDDKRLLVSGNDVIVVMFLLPPGIYFILISQKEKIVKKKLVVQ